MTQTWPEEDYQNQLPLDIQKARELLEDWFWAMENNTMEERKPDLFFPIQFSEENIDKAIRLLDEGFERELHWVSSENYTAGPEFKRLALPQRLALVQQLHSILKTRVPTSPTRVID